MLENSLMEPTGQTQAKPQPRAVRTLAVDIGGTGIKALVLSATGKPLIIHTRNASEDTLAILKEEGEGADAEGRAGGVFHCFTESQAVARAALDLGFYISFSGILTFKTAADLREVAQFVPLDRILIETDSPYLAPMPYRGKTNNPSYVPYVAKLIAELKNESLETIAYATSRNFEQLFAGVTA